MRLIKILLFILTIYCYSCGSNAVSNNESDHLKLEIQRLNNNYQFTQDSIYLDSILLICNNDGIDLTDQFFLFYKLYVFAQKNQNQNAIDFLNTHIKINETDNVGRIIREVYRNIFLMRDAKSHGNDSLAEKYLDENIAIFKNRIGENERKIMESLYNVNGGPDGFPSYGGHDVWIINGYLTMLAMKDKQLAIDESRRLSETYPKVKNWIDMSMSYITGLNQFTLLTLSSEEINSITTETNEAETWEECTESIISDSLY